jgi:hypothetical protein
MVIFISKDGEKLSQKLTKFSCSENSPKKKTLKVMDVIQFYDNIVEC